MAGQVLATVDSPELTNQLEQAEAALAQRKLELERQRIDTRQQLLEKRKTADLAEVAVIAARREMRRAEEAKGRDVIPLIDYEKAQDDLRNAELAFEHAMADAKLHDERLSFELRASQFELNAQELAVENLHRQVYDLAIKSPVNGIVGDLHEIVPAITAALRESGGNRKRAAEILGISRATFYRRLKTLGLDE